MAMDALGVGMALGKMGRVLETTMNVRAFWQNSVATLQDRSLTDIGIYSQKSYEYTLGSQTVRSETFVLCIPVQMPKSRHWLMATTE